MDGCHRRVIKIRASRVCTAAVYLCTGMMSFLQELGQPVVFHDNVINLTPVLGKYASRLTSWKFFELVDSIRSSSQSPPLLEPMQ